MTRTLDEYTKLGEYHRELRLSRTWLPRYFRRFHIALCVVKDLLPVNSNIADIGGGEGVLVEALKNHGFFNSVGVDPFAPFGAAKMVRGDLIDLPFMNNKLDAVISFDVLEHIPLHRQEQAGRELFRVLKPGGIAIISIPNMAHLKSRFQFMLAGRPWRNRMNKHPGELSAWERRDILTLAGFEVIDQVGIHMTLSYNPRPMVPFGKFLSKVMFRPDNPAGLCWTVLLLLCKPPVPDQVIRMKSPLKKALRGYHPFKEDPTST